MHPTSRQNPTAPPFERTRVIKKLLPQQPGTIKLARRYGNALVCVRYRQDAEGVIRYTTVELLVSEARIQKTAGTELVSVQIEAHEFELLRRIRSSGGQWEADQYTWRITRNKAKRLGLLNRVVRT